MRLCRAAEPATSSVRPLQAEVLAPLDVSRLKEGAHVKAQVVEDWRNGSCHLERGALLDGRVVQVTRRSKTQKGSSFQLAFDKADCARGVPMEYGLTLIAIIGPYGDSPWAGGGLSEGPPLADAPGIAIGVPTGTRESQGRNGGAAMRSENSAAYVNEFTVRKIRKLPAQILPGQVVDVPKVELHVGTGLDGASVISVNKGDARLEGWTTLIFVPSTALRTVQHEVKLIRASGSRPQSSAGDGATHAGGTEAAPSQPLAETEAPDETEICSGTCNVVGALDARAAKSSEWVGGLPMSALGYAPHDKQRALSFNNETTLTFLDDHHLLCTFDPHVLRSRSADGTEPIRKVRAVLIDPTGPKVLNVTEWRVRGDDGYLWRYGTGKVLVHMEHELRLYDSHLDLLKSIRVDGPVPWVVSSPSNDHTAVAVIQRRFSMDEWREMHETGERPDEDMEVRVYDRDWKLVSMSLRALNSPEPVLADGGELRISKAGTGRWKISEYGWDRTEHNLATVRSICRPLVSAPTAELTFVTGCMASSGNAWYRMLRADGHPLLKAESTSNEIVQSSEGAPGGLFAIRVLKATKPVTVDQPFNRADLVKEDIEVYRSGNGARVASIVTENFILAQNSYALSPDAQRMAVAGNDGIRFYALGQ